VQNVCGRRLPRTVQRSPFRDRLGLVRLARPELLASALLGALLGGIGGAVHPWLWLLGLPLPLFTAWFFRDPERAIPDGDDLVVAPADGLLDDVRREPHCPFFAGPAVRLGIYLSLLDVHLNRAPVRGTTVRVRYQPGRHAPTVRRGATDGNEQLVTTFAASAAPLEVVVRQIAGPLARRICHVLGEGDRVELGQRFGLIKFGSRTELWLPADPRVEIVARSGERVRGGVTVLARFQPG
jgi:phosphatidylserine decarboxylase